MIQAKAQVLILTRTSLTTGTGKNKDEREEVHRDDCSEDLEDFHK